MSPFHASPSLTPRRLYFALASTHFSPRTCYVFSVSFSLFLSLLGIRVWSPPKCPRLPLSRPAVSKANDLPWNLDNLSARLQPPRPGGCTCSAHDGSPSRLSSLFSLALYRRAVSRLLVSPDRAAIRLFLSLSLSRLFREALTASRRVF